MTEEMRESMYKGHGSDNTPDGGGERGGVVISLQAAPDSRSAFGNGFVRTPLVHQLLHFPSKCSFFATRTSFISEHSVQELFHLLPSVYCSKIDMPSLNLCWASLPTLSLSALYRWGPCLLSSSESEQLGGRAVVLLLLKLFIYFLLHLPLFCFFVNIHLIPLLSLQGLHLPPLKLSPHIHLSQLLLPADDLLCTYVYVIAHCDLFVSLVC